MNLKRVLSLGLILLPLLLGCGPDNKSVQADQDQARQLIMDGIAKYAPLVGNYDGALTYDNSQKAPTEVRLTVIPIMLITGGASRNEVVRVPSIGGTLVSYKARTEKLDHPETADEKQSRMDVVLYAYGPGEYDEKTARLDLLTSSTGSQATVYNSLVGTVNGDTITARIYGAYDAETGTLIVKRTAKLKK